MNIKKLGASILAAAMLITSGSMSMHSAASTSDIVMISLKEYDTKITITDKTESQLDEGISIGDILDKMVYKGDQTDKDGNSFTDGASVAIPVDATVVWVGNNKYSIFERDVKVRLSQYSTYDIIVGSGKQLDPNNIIYHLSADITPVTFVIDWENSDVKLYTISEDGTVKPFDSSVRSNSNSSLYLDCKKKAPHEKVAADISKLKIKLSNGANMPEYKIKFYSDYNSYSDDIELTADDQGRILFELDKPSAGSYYDSTTLYYSLCNPDGEPLDGADSHDYAYIYTYYPRISFYAYLGSEFFSDSSCDLEDGVNSITYWYTLKLDPGESAENVKTFRLSNFYGELHYGDSLKNDILKSVKGDRADLAAAEKDDDITEALFGRGVEGNFEQGERVTIFLDPASENVKPFLDTDDASAYVLHFGLMAVETRLYTTLDMEVDGVSNASIYWDTDDEGETTDNGYSRSDVIWVSDLEKDASYYISKLQRKADRLDLKDKVVMAVKGKFTSSEATKDAEEIDINDLFDSTKGYKFTPDIVNGDNITVFLDAKGDSPANALCTDENATEFIINLHFDVIYYDEPDPEPDPEPEYEFVDVDDSELPPDIKNTHFNVESISDEKGTIIKTSLGLHSDDEATYFDTYGKYGSQTIFAFADEGKESIDLSKIRLNVKKDYDLRVFLIEDGKATYVDLDTETQDFSDGKPKHYATAKRQEGNKYYKQGNYYVTVKTGNNATGSGLFVEGPSDQNGQQSGTRTIFFDSYYGEAYHDIVIANLGSAPLTNLTAQLTNPKNIKLNGFWDLNGEYELAPMTVTVGNSSMTTVKRVENMAKIRIEPETNENGRPKRGDISGTLTISADGQPTYVINLSGKISTPTIITNELSEAVKFVPYSSIISVDTVHKWLTTKFSVYDGDLPEGLTLNEYSGELYGVPQEAGTYRFRIRAKTSWEGNAEFSPSYITKSFTLVIKENTDENVYYASDENYTITTSIGTADNTFDFVLPDTMITEDQKFVSVGEYGDFIDFWLNGEKLEEGTDYTSEAGSTVITIKSQTLSGLTKGEANTIAAEFRVGGQLENALKRTAQNFTIKTPKPEDPGTSTPGTSDDTSSNTSSDTSGGTNTPSTSGGSGAVGSVTDPDTSSSTSTPDTSDSTSTPSESDIVFKPVHVDGELADIINGTTVTAPQGVMSKDAILAVTVDSNVPADKGMALDITFTVNGEKVQPSGDMTVRMPIPDNLKNVSSLYVYHITNGKYDFVDSWREGDYICFKAGSFSTYVISGKKLDSNGNPVSSETADTSNNPLTGIGVSATGIILSAAVLAVILTIKKKKH